jgi:anaerobic ribonucleoside-triphosphate reductase activating protein
MNYVNIIPCDTANGEGIRTSLFVSGCPIHCPGCFNQEAQDYSYGQPYTNRTHNTILEQINKPYIAGLSLLGGDPMCQDYDGLVNLISLAQEVRNMGKTVWLWTGLTYEDIFPAKGKKDWGVLEYARQCLFMACNVVVDGPFIESQKDLTLAFRGSKNQRIIDVEETLKADKIILYKE